MNDDDENGLFTLLLVLGLCAPVAILRGFVFTKLWLWFVMPFGVEQIGVAHAIGLAGFISLYTGSPVKPGGQKTGGELLMAVGSILSATLFVWAFGAVIHSFM